MPEYRKLSEITASDTLSENGKIIVEDGGLLRRVPKSAVGGTGSTDISALETAIAGKADIAHTHADLTAAIADKADIVHTHADLSAAIAGKANSTHTHADLTAAISGKADAVHTHADLSGEISALESAMGTYANAYTTAHINERKADIAQLLKGGKCFAFATLCDAHLYADGDTSHQNRNDQVRDFQLLAEALPIDYVICEGDILHNTEQWSGLYEPRLEFFAQTMNNIRCPWWAVRGNHDFNRYTGADGQYVNNDVWHRSMTAQFHMTPGLSVHLPEGYEKYGFYYVDDAYNKHRAIMLNAFISHEDDYGKPYVSEGVSTYNCYNFRAKQQMQWLMNTAMDMSGKTDWVVSLHGHEIPYTDEGSEDVSEFHGYPDGANDICSIIEAFQTGTSVSITGNLRDLDLHGNPSVTLTKDFTAQGPISVIGFFSGHVHDDCFKCVDGINYFVSTNNFCARKTTWGTDASPAKLPPERNTTDKAMSVNVYIVNRTTKTVYQIKVGAKRNSSVRTSSDVAATFDTSLSNSPCTAISLSASGTAISEANGTAAIAAATTPSACTDPIFWGTSDSSVATIEADGETCTVTGVADGAATITAYCGGFSASQTIIVGVPSLSAASQPSDTSAVVGAVSGALTFTATASDSSAVAYQWYSNTSKSASGGTIVSDATTSSMTIPTALAAGTYYYYCVATSDTAGTLASNAVSVTIAAITISAVTQPVDVSVTAGAVTGSLTFEASSSDSSAIAYQWYSSTTNANTGGNEVSGAANASMTIPASLAAGTYYYYCIATSATAGSITSNCVVVTVAAAQAAEIDYQIWLRYVNTGSSVNYIATDYYPNDRTKIVAKISYSGGNPGAVFGVSDAQYENAFWLTGTTSSGSDFLGKCGTAQVAGALSKTSNMVYTVNKDGVFTGENAETAVGTFSGVGTFTSQYPLYLFNRNIGGTPTTISSMSMRIHYLNIYETNDGVDTLVMELKPALQSDGVTLGMYDAIGGQWYLPNTQEGFTNT